MQVPEQLQPYAVESKFDRGELTVWVAPEKLLEACRILKNDLRFVRLSDVTAVDWFPREPRYEVVYHLHCLERKQRMRLKVRLAGDNPEVDSATAVWRSANWYEREVLDLFGIRFRNHPDPRRIMMPDDWVGHPLRKDYPVEGYK
jgi:NADH-quinone oxidoreductase subunit C